MSNGYANEQTYNVALWILNDEGLYNFAKAFRNRPNPYTELKDNLREVGTIETPDRVSYNDSSLNVDELNEVIREL